MNIYSIHITLCTKTLILLHEAREDGAAMQTHWGRCMKLYNLLKIHSAHCLRMYWGKEITYSGWCVLGIYVGRTQSLDFRPAWVDEAINWTVERVEGVKTYKKNINLAIYVVQYMLDLERQRKLQWEIGTGRLLWVKQTYRWMIARSQTDLSHWGSDGITT